MGNEELLKKEIEESHDSKSDVDEDVDTTKRMPMFPPMHMPPSLFGQMFLPPWFFMRPPPKFGLGNFFFPPPGYLKTLDGGYDVDDDMDEDEDMDEHDIDDIERLYEGPEDHHGGREEHDSHYEDDAQSLDEDYFSSYDQHFEHPYGKRLRQRRSLVDSFSVKDSDEFWQDIDGGIPNEVSEFYKMATPGYAAYAETQKRLDHYGSPQHIGYIDTGRIKHGELSLPKDRAFGKGFDFNDGDMDSFAFKPTGQRFSNNEE